jgi:hypothetical protein
MSANALSVAVKTSVLVVGNKAYRAAVAADPVTPIEGEISAVVGKRVVRLVPVTIEFAASNG